MEAPRRWASWADRPSPRPVARAWDGAGEVLALTGYPRQPGSDHARGRWGQAMTSCECPAHADVPRPLGDAGSLALRRNRLGTEGLSLPILGHQAAVDLRTWQAYGGHSRPVRCGKGLHLRPPFVASSKGLRASATYSVLILYLPRHPAFPRSSECRCRFARALSRHLAHAADSLDFGSHRRARSRFRLPPAAPDPTSPQVPPAFLRVANRPVRVGGRITRHAALAG